MTVLGAIFTPDLPPERLRPVAQAADRSGLEQLWLWEDCFRESGIATAGAVLGWTRQLTVGVGLLPVPLRNVALTAMELATLERLFPGRVVPGVGHGVLDWMGQVGARAGSPMTLLREYTTALRALLHGQRVSVDGRYVHLDDVALDWPPQPAPPLLVGGIRDRTVRLAGELADGLIMTGDTSPGQVRAAAAVAAPDDAAAFRVVVFMVSGAGWDGARIAERVSEYAAAGATHVILQPAPDEQRPLEQLVELVAGEVRRLVP